MGNLKAKRNYRRTVLRLPDLDHSKAAVLNSLTSPGSRRVYRYAIEQFIAWYCSEPRLAFNRIVVVRLPHVSGRARLAGQHDQSATGSGSTPGTRSRGRRIAEPRTGRRDQPWERRQATRVSLGELAYARAEHGSSEPGEWSRAPCQARLCHVGHVAGLWATPIRVSWARTSRGPNPPGALGHCGFGR
jgi:hypothetical protein